MKYSEALKLYNEGKDKWCIPKKGSKDYEIIRNIMKMDIIILHPSMKILKKYDEYKNAVPKLSKEAKETKVKEPKVSKVDKVSNETNVSISTNIFSNKKYSKSSKKCSSKRSSVFIEQVDNKQNANIIANFLRNKLIKDKYTLNNRIAFYKYINKMIVDINGDECLETKVFKSRKGYTINNKINLYKKIGTESAYGVIYLTSIVNSFGGFTIASKVMPNNANNIKEIKLMKYVNDEILLKNKSRHFVFMYKHAICNKIPFDDKHRIVCVNELAHGDLKMLMTQRELLKNNELIMNLLFQTFISIGTFHNILNYCHNDCHHGNFLYQKNNEEGYYEYSFNGKSYYLKSCGYNIMIYDFGLSQKINHNENDDIVNKTISKDYRRIINAFMGKRYGWGQYVDLPNFENNKKLVNVITVLSKIVSINENDYFENIIKNVFIPFSPPEMWLTVRPKNVINKVAFHIS
jgi:hypothetical protein